MFLCYKETPLKAIHPSVSCMHKESVWCFIKNAAHVLFQIETPNKE